MTFNLIADRIEVFILKSYKKLTLKRIYPALHKKKMFDLNLKKKNVNVGVSCQKMDGHSHTPPWCQKRRKLSVSKDQKC
jgi:hypothetical protein